MRWGANDGPDDAFENFNRWPELHALGADDDILRMYAKGHDGLIRQYTEARTTDVPIARQGMYHKEFIVQSDWMHHGEGLQLFNRMGLSMPADATYQQRARRFAGFYMNEDPDAPNYDPAHKIIRSMQNGSRGPMLRKATALDWVGDPFDVKGFDALHGESTFEQFLAHYEEYTDVVGDHFLNLAATTLATNAYLLAGEPKYKTWLLEYMDAWLDRMQRNGGIIPSFVDLDGRIGGPEGKWWGNAYGWGFSPVNPVTGRREDRNRIQWAIVGLSERAAGERRAEIRRRMAPDDRRRELARARGRWPAAVPDHARRRRMVWLAGHAVERRGAGGVVLVAAAARPRARQRPVDRISTRPQSAVSRAGARAGSGDRRRSGCDAVRRDKTPPERRLADNMLDYNPVSTESLVQLMWGALMPGRPGGLLNARLRYFDPERKRAGIPEDVAALVSELSDTQTTVTLVNLNPSRARTVIVQGGGYGEHQLVSVTHRGQTTTIGSPLLTVHLEPGSGETLVLAMKRYANTPTVLHPWHRAGQ